MIEDDTLANITARSIIGGFVQPGQDELLQPFSATYFGAIAGVWERRSSEVAQTVVIGLYPSWDISQAGLDAADVPGRPGCAAAAAEAGGRGPRKRRSGRCGPAVRQFLSEAAVSASSPRSASETESQPALWSQSRRRDRRLDACAAD